MIATRSDYPDLGNLHAIPRSDLYYLAKEDHADAKAAVAAGEPIPNTPYLEELTRRQAEMTNPSAPTTTTTKRTTPGLRFYHDGKPQPDNQNKLSTLAYDYTKNVDGDSPRVPVARLREILAEAGIDPSGPFTFTLPNGIVLSAVLETPEQPTTTPGAQHVENTGTHGRTQVARSPILSEADPDKRDEMRAAAKAAKDQPAETKQERKNRLARERRAAKKASAA